MWNACYADVQVNGVTVDVLRVDFGGVEGFLDPLLTGTV